MFKPSSAYRKAEPQAPVYSNILNNSSYSNAPSYANIGNILIFPIKTIF